jgi:hypothetical protein
MDKELFAKRHEPPPLPAHNAQVVKAVVVGVLCDDKEEG